LSCGGEQGHGDVPDSEKSVEGLKRLERECSQGGGREKGREGCVDKGN